MKDPVRIAIADDSEVVRNLIEEIARFEPGFELVASFDNGRDIAAWVREGGRADVFVIDMRLPGLSGTATISALRRRLADARILAFSASAQEESVNAALAAGADDYLLKESSLGDLLDAISADGARAESAPAATPATAVPAADADSRGHGFTVLVIDDHDLVRDATTAMLEAKRFSVHACASADEARSWLTAGNAFDAALVDVRLGEESGAEMVSEIHAVAPLAAVLLHSGAADTDGARLVRESGADGFLAKGDYTIDEMVRSLTSAIEQRRGGAGT